MKKSGIFIFAFLLIFAFLEKGETNGVTIQDFANPLSLKPTTPKTALDFGRMPVYFIANQGQMDERVDYYVQGRDKSLYFTSEGVTIALIGRSTDKSGDLVPRDPNRGDRARKDIEAASGSRWVVKADFVGANRDVKPVGEEEAGAIVSYFKGKPEGWKTGLPTYSKIAYKNLWPGIDLLFYGTVDRMKYEFIVHPGANPSGIRLAYRGASGIGVTVDGRLAVTTPVGGFEDDVPAAWQDVGGKKANVSVAYDLGDDAVARRLGGGQETEAPGLESATYEYGFHVGDYDHSRPLVLDPAVLVYCGFVGGWESDAAYGIAVDRSRNAYITGYTYSPMDNFPVVVGPDLTQSGNGDAFVAKVNASGTALVYCGYLGGSGVDQGFGIAVDDLGNAYIAGMTGSTETTFPVAKGPDLIFNGTLDAFIAKVNSSGTALDYCGYIGGAADDRGFGVAVDGPGNAYVTGYTESNLESFPVVTGPGLNFMGIYDAFVAKVNDSGTALVYCGYIGGLSEDIGYGIAVDGYGNAYITGRTISSEATFPVVVGPDLTHNDAVAGWRGGGCFRGQGERLGDGS